MKKIGLLGIAVILILAGCGKQASGVKLAKGTPAYDTAKEAAMKVPELDPDKNEVWVKCDYFNVTTGDIMTFLFDNMGSRAAQLTSLDEQRIRDEISRIVAQIADRRLLYRVAEATGVKVTDAEVDSMLAKQYNHPQFGSKEKFEAWAQQQGISLDFIRKDFTEILTIQKGLDSLLADQTNVTEEDIAKAYNEPQTASVRHILMLTQGKSDSAKQEIHKKMEDILARAKKGEDFAKLAEKYSEDPGSKDKGGLYEDFPRGQMVKPFEDAAFETPVGQITDIVETTYGYHILKIVGHKKETRPFAEVRDEIKTRLEAAKKQTAYTNLIQKLKDESHYETMLP